MAKIVAACLSQEKGSKTQPISLGFLKEDYGLVGDAHAGSSRQRSLLGGGEHSQESITSQ